MRISRIFKRVEGPALSALHKKASPSSMRKFNAIVYWLVPATPERELFRELIRILAKQFEAPRFEPHLTLVAIADDGRAPREILRQIHAPPIHLGVRGIGFSSRFTKTLFVRFESSKSLEKLVVDLGRELRKRTKSVRDPHVSLLYKKLPRRVKKELVSTIKLPFEEVTFDFIQAVRSALPIRDGSDVKAWKVVAKKRLAG
jgi:2'-5' RNA ligase